MHGNQRALKGCKPKFFILFHPDVGEKRIIKDLIIMVNDYLVEDKDREFVLYNLVKMNHGNYDKSNIAKVKKLFMINSVRKLSLLVILTIN